jgi:HEAT repeat protein
MSETSEIQKHIKALADKDASVRQKAANALTGIAIAEFRFGGDTSVVRPLIEALKNKDSRVRFIVISALNAIYSPGSYRAEDKAIDKAALSALTKALKDKSDDVRWTAAETLGYLRDKSAIPALRKALKDKNELVRLRARKALESLQPWDEFKG